MLIEKIVVIAMGLVAVVPHNDRDQGVSILMRDALRSTPRAERKNGTDPSCPVHLHVPWIQQIDGYCEGDCSPINAQEGHLNSLSALIPSPANADPARKGLIWMPVAETIAFEGLTGRSTPHETDKKYWFEYGGGARVGNDCMNNASGCPIVARFDMDKGGVHVCRLSEYSPQSKYNNSQTNRSGPAGFVVEQFEEVRDQGHEHPHGNPRAESYAVELATSMQAPLRLTSTSFGSQRTAKLFPDHEGKIVLLVSNLAPAGPHNAGPPECARISETATSHSAVMYDLAEGPWPPDKQLVLHMADRVTGTHPQPECAKRLDRPELKALARIFDVPSDPSKCKPTGVLNP